MVHRLLAASLRLTELPESSKDRESVRALADNLNTRHRNAQMAGRASVELHTLIFFKDRTVLADARVTKVRLSTPTLQRAHGSQPKQLLNQTTKEMKHGSWLHSTFHMKVPGVHVYISVDADNLGEAQPVQHD